MMAYEYDPAENVIHLRASGILERDDPINYFHAVANDASIKPNAVERVYFQDLDDIAFKCSDVQMIRDTFNLLDHHKRLAYTEFITDSDFTYGMARMIIGIFSHPTHQFLITRKD